MRVLAKLAAVFVFASLLSGTVHSQAASSQASAPQIPRMTNGYGVSNIAGQPFSADMEIDRTQTLADGSHVHSVQHVKFYRDGEGRIRYEIYNHQGPSQQGPEEVSTVIIADTIANIQYSLQPRAHAAHRSIIFAPPTPTPAPPRPVPSPNPQQTPPTPKHVSESLGTQTIEGIVAEGHRNTTTWPVNSQGNDAPLVSVIEQWQSAEMGLEVLQKISDLRMGDTVRRFTNIVRGEPDPSLFQVPSDYTIKDM